MKYRFAIVLFFLLSAVGFAQIVYTDPLYATRFDSIIVYFDASLCTGEGGNDAASLENYSGSDVYAHTGVTIEGEGNWKNVIADWGINLPKAQLTKISTNLWKLVIGDPYEYYGVSRLKKITKLDFVFRNSNGSKSGRDVGGADIFLDLFDSGLSIVINAPVVNTDFGDSRRSPVFIAQDAQLGIEAVGVALGTEVESMILKSDGLEIFSVNDDSLNYTFQAQGATGMTLLRIIAVDTSGLRDSVEFAVMVNPEVADAPRPAGFKEGLTISDQTTATFVLFAPYKNYVYLLGDFNDWQVSEDYYLKREQVDADSVYWWITLSELEPSVEYAYQFLVDGEIRVADPYAGKVLDPWNDQYIQEVTYPALKDYPAGATTEFVSVFKTNPEVYDWQTTDFQPPAQSELIIYELLVRDYLAAHDFATLTDTLNYLENLGVNAVELMPVNDFEGNESWGYNPAFYFSPDKYYGPAGDLKAFVDAAHARGIAVILDMVLNHSYGQSPFVRLYNEGNYGQPTPENPWYNVTSPNPTYSWGYDFNHESPSTKKLIDRINQYWLTEFRVDGFRFDFSKGFTNTPGDGWNYDAARINILKRMADQIWAVNDQAYVILEHFTDNAEELNLARYGMMVWNNKVYNYQEAGMGFYSKGDFSTAYYKNRGWDVPHLVSYMESHDEERLMYKMLTYGASSGDYSVKDMNNALQRQKLLGAFFLTMPGPKMLWQFSELGYDYSIDYNDRVGNKPIRWDYFQDEARRRVYKTWQALLKIRAGYGVFSDAVNSSVTMDVDGAVKWMKMTHISNNVLVVGNFDVTDKTTTIYFQHGGDWYNFFSGETLAVPSGQLTLQLKPGEFILYSDQKMYTPESGLVTGLPAERPDLPLTFLLEQNYPNPFNPQTRIAYTLGIQQKVSLEIFDLLGRKVKTLVTGEHPAGRYEVVWNGLDEQNHPAASGVYLYKLRSGRLESVRKMVLIR